jgi:hypothetical protein
LKRTNLLQARTVASGRRFAREVAQRLAVLTDDELELLVDSTTTERSHLLWPAACRRYDLIGNFASRVRALAVAEGFEPSADIGQVRHSTQVRDLLHGQSWPTERALSTL